MSKVTVFRIWNRDKRAFVRSGRGRYAKNGRTLWAKKSGAIRAVQELPVGERIACVIKEYELVEIAEHESIR